MYVALTRARHHIGGDVPREVYSSRRGAEYSIDTCRDFSTRFRDT